MIKNKIPNIVLEDTDSEKKSRRHIMSGLWSFLCVCVWIFMFHYFWAYQRVGEGSSSEMAHGRVWADMELWRMEGRVLDLFCCQLWAGRLHVSVCTGGRVCWNFVYFVCVCTGVCGAIAVFQVSRHTLSPLAGNWQAGIFSDTGLCIHFLHYLVHVSLEFFLAVHSGVTS